MKQIVIKTIIVPWDSVLLNIIPSDIGRNNSDKKLWLKYKSDHHHA